MCLCHCLSSGSLWSFLETEGEKTKVAFTSEKSRVMENEGPQKTTKMFVYIMVDSASIYKHRRTDRMEG